MNNRQLPLLSKQGFCGDCGMGNFSVYTPLNGDRDMNSIYLQCTHCKNVSVVTLSAPKLEVKFAEGSKGIIHF